MNDRSEKKYIVCFFAPAMVILIGFAGYITVELFYLALTRWNIKSPTPTFIGIKNFIDIAVDVNFWRALSITSIFTVCSVTLEIVLGFIVAFALFRKIAGLGIVRTLVIIPMAMTPVVVAMFWKIIYDPTLGPLNYFLSLVGITGPEWLSSTRIALFSLILVNVWEWMPFSFLVITAGMSALPKDVYDAAMIDGANFFQIIYKITVPMLKQVLLVLILLRTIDALKTFDLVFVMTHGGPGDVTQILPFYIYLKGFKWFDLGYASALSVVLLFFVMLIVRTYINNTGIKVFYED